MPTEQTSNETSSLNKKEKPLNNKDLLLSLMDQIWAKSEKLWIDQKQLEPFLNNPKTNINLLSGIINKKKEQEEKEREEDLKKLAEEIIKFNECKEKIEKDLADELKQLKNNELFNIISNSDKEKLTKLEQNDSLNENPFDQIIKDIISWYSDEYKNIIENPENYKQQLIWLFLWIKESSTIILKFWFDIFAWIFSSIKDIIKLIKNKKNFSSSIDP